MNNLYLVCSRGLHICRKIQKKKKKEGMGERGKKEERREGSIVNLKRSTPQK